MHEITKDEAQQLLIQFSNGNNHNPEITTIADKSCASKKQRTKAGKLANDPITSHKTKMVMNISADSHILPLKTASSPSSIMDHSVASLSSSLSNDNTVSFGNVFSYTHKSLFQPYGSDSVHYQKYRSFDQALDFHTRYSSSNINFDTNALSNASDISDNAHQQQNTSHIYSIASLVGTSQIDSPAAAIPLTSPMLPTNTPACIPHSIITHSSIASPLVTYACSDILPSTTRNPQTQNTLTDITNGKSSAASSSSIGTYVCPYNLPPSTANPQALNIDIINRGNMNGENIPPPHPDANNDGKDVDNNELIISSTDDSNDESVVANVISPNNMLKGNAENMPLILMSYY